MSEKPERPRHSFRWTILLWFAIPLAWIALVDHFVAWRMAKQQDAQRAAAQQEK